MNLDSLIQETIKSAKLTRLVASENITVEYSTTATTASFTPATRTITYPYSMAMEDEDIHLLFIFHEVGHAIFSENTDLFNAGVKEKIAGQFNITEDIRIEKLIKQRYPGVIKNFHAGYKKLLDRGFFGETNRINLMSFPNRLNIYAKIGPVTGSFIKFSPEETEFYNRCVSAETEQQAYDLAVELSKMNTSDVDIQDIIDSIKEMMEDNPDSFIDDLSSMIEKMTSELTGDSEGSHVTAGSQCNDYRSKEDIESAIEQVAQEISEFNSQEHFQEKFQETTVSDCSVISYSPADREIVSVYPANRYHAYVSRNVEKSVDSTREYVKTLKSSVDSMAREFEAKKAAFRYVNRKVSDTGLLDVNRVVNYRFSDEIFRQKVNVADAKNHGFVILLDCSGSIKNSFVAMTKQVVVLTEFFRKIGVKYKVYGYGAYMMQHRSLEKKCKFNSLAYQSQYSQNEEFLIEFLNSEQKQSEHILNIHGMLNTAGIKFCQTPTVDAFSQLEYLANEFFSSNNIHIRKIINITDGSPSDLNLVFHQSDIKKVLVVDPDTKKSYMSNAYPYAPIDIMGSIFKKRYDISLVSIAIDGGKHTKETFTGYPKTDQDDKQMKKDNFYRIVSPHGNDVFIVNSVDVSTDLDDIKIQDTDSVTVAFGKFKKALIKNNRSKNFLNILSQYLSV